MSVALEGYPAPVFRDGNGDWAYSISNSGVVLCGRDAAVQNGVD